MTTVGQTPAQTGLVTPRRLVGAATLIGLLLATVALVSRTSGPVQRSTVVGASTPTQADASAIDSPSQVSASDPVSRIGELEQTVKTSPTDGKSWQSLAGAYLRRAFETADPSYYLLTTNALDRTESILGKTVEVHVLRANLMLALHDFTGARTEADAALAIQPTSFDATVALTDAMIETGDYMSARELIDTLVDVRPGVASLSRLSYYRQLTGDILGAEAAMRAAISAAPAESIDRAVALAYLGEIQLERGVVDPADRSFTEALRLNPASPVAAIGKAHVQAARLDWASAITTLDDLVEQTPAPGAFGLRADIARATGDAAGARAADQLVDASMALLKSNGATVDADLAMLLADRGPSSAPDALKAAAQAYADRQTIFTNDAMAWALAQSGRTGEAVPYAEAALMTNPQVASIHWHAAVIFDAQGDRKRAARELTAAMRNPAFSPSQAAAVRAMAQRYGLKS